MADKVLEKLLNQESVNKSIDEAVAEEIANAKKEKVEKVIKDIKKVPHKSVLWGNKTIFYVFNREQETEQEVTGAQARSLFGSNTSAIKSLERGEKSQATTDTYVIKFVEYKV